MLEKKIGKITSSARRVSQYSNKHHQSGDDGHALAGGIDPTALFPEPPPPSEVASRATAATRPAFSGAPPVVFFIYISIYSVVFSFFYTSISLSV